MNWDQPYPATRPPVCAENVVATSQPLATQAGLDAMRRGGNAVLISQLRWPRHRSTRRMMGAPQMMGRRMSKHLW